MAIRLLVWNIQKFGQNKLRASPFDRAGRRKRYIETTIAEANPDIVAIIEVQTTQQDGVGSLIGDASGGPAARALWRLLPGGPITAGGPWALVPPLLINVNLGRSGDTAYSEGVAVYFRTDKLDFTGPFKWTGPESHRGAQPLSAPAAAATYAAPWNNCLPTTAPYGGAGGLNQNQLAGQALFYDGAAPPNQIFFGDQPLPARAGARGRRRAVGETDIFARNPWLTTFVENAGANRGRAIKLWSVHFPPSLRGSRVATAMLARIPAVTAPLQDSEVRVIGGDFNVNALAPAEADIFGQLTNGTLVENTGAATALFYQRFAWRTAMTTVSRATAAGGGEFYGYAKPRALDNILTAYGRTAGAPANPEVINRVVGTPRQDVQNPPAAEYTVALADPIPTILASGVTAALQTSAFRSPANYGQIGGGLGTSDHAPIVIDL